MNALALLGLIHVGALAGTIFAYGLVRAIEWLEDKYDGMP